MLSAQEETVALGLWVSRSPCSSLAVQDVLAALKKFSLYLAVSSCLAYCSHSQSSAQPLWAQQANWHSLLTVLNVEAQHTEVLLAALALLPPLRKGTLKVDL